MRQILLALISVLAFQAMAFAAPAPWFRYQSLVSGRYLCSQVDPGVHYRKASGPWSNAGCRP
jgi:hypothetical protein